MRAFRPTKHAAEVLFLFFARPELITKPDAAAFKVDFIDKLWQMC